MTQVVNLGSDLGQEIKIIGRIEGYAAPDQKLQVFVDERLVHELTMNESTSFEISLSPSSLVTAAQSNNSHRLTIKSSGAGYAKALIQSIESLPNPFGTIHIKESDSGANSVQVSFENASTVSNILAYVESNAIEGLQLGVGGDTAISITSHSPELRTLEGPIQQEIQSIL